MTFVANVLASLAVALLRALWAREDLKDSVRLEMANAAQELALKAVEWKLTAGQLPDGGASLRDAGGTLGLPGHDPAP